MLPAACAGGGQQAGQQRGVLLQQQVAGIGAQLRAARQCLGGLRPALLQYGHQLGTQEVAVVAGVGVAGIFDPLQTMCLRIRQHLGARVRQQGAPQHAGGEGTLRAHRGQAVRAGSAQCAQQEGFGLIVAMVRKRQPFAGRQCGGKRDVACMACRRFQPQATVARDLYLRDL
ncbi:hypothetical protein XPU_1848 [Xanthomonas arboricola pv. pruni str. MAFF 311562]|uniref:Uncharacterized protein n=1 Tax=Xanthomonas arboricola pv. pruni str. MAFF 311562 TaxID=1414836 RepID=W4S198_9XANT|nr:hypothetical protein XPU_1848 [Xanthomonas arboricola pv. pruni str. MAFF 311562]